MALSFFQKDILSDQARRFNDVFKGPCSLTRVNLIGVSEVRWFVFNVGSVLKALRGSPLAAAGQQRLCPPVCSTWFRRYWKCFILWISWNNWEKISSSILFFLLFNQCFFLNKLILKVIAVPPGWSYKNKSTWTLGSVSKKSFKYFTPYHCQV